MQCKLRCTARKIYAPATVQAAWHGRHLRRNDTVAFLADDSIRLEYANGLAMTMLMVTIISMITETMAAYNDGIDDR